MASINTNMSANIAANSMTRNERSMSSTMERLSTGLRINSAKDDAAGLAISSKMTSQINGLNQAVRNANDAISMIQVAEGVMKEVTNMFQRMRELAVQAISDSNTIADRTALNNEYKQLSDEVKRVAENTQWNGTNILDGARTQTTFQIGANASQTIQVNFGDLGTDNIKNAAVVVDTDTPKAAASGDASSGTVGINAISVTGTVAAGDIITVKVDSGTAGAQYASFELTTEAAAALNTTDTDADDLGATASGQIIESKVDGSSSLTALSTSAAAGLVAEVIAGQVVIKGTTTGAGADFTISDAELSRGTQAPVGGSDITTSALANTALGVLDTAIGNVNSTRAGLGASMSRLEYASDNLQNVAQNTASARSRVLDADYAAETTELARTQIIQQAATAMLAQANQSQQAVLSLLR
jgi:flagellin